MEKLDRRSFLAGLLGGAALGAIGTRLVIVQTMPYPAIAAPVTVGDGVWLWLNDPHAISVNGSPVIGAISSVGDLLVYEADGSSVDLRGSTFQQDDHASPSLLLRSSDSKILVFASAHNGSAIYTYLSTNANDASAFGAETSIDAQLGLSLYSYMTPIQLTGETDDPIYLFFRGDEAGTRHYQYSKSTDQGVTWSAATRLLTNDGLDADFPPYVKAVANGDDRIDFFCTDGHPQHHPEGAIYHFYYEGDAFKDTGGTPLTLPIEVAADLTPLYDGSAGRAWIWDCAVDGSGNPACVYATIPSETDFRYHYAIWNGGGWTDNEVCAAGRTVMTLEIVSDYAGGITIDPENVNRVVASVEIDGIHQLVRFVTDDSGASWTADQMTDGATLAFRPTFVRGQATEPRLAYLTGTYDHFTDYDTDIVLIDSRTALPTQTSNRTLSDASDRTTSDAETRTIEELT